MGKSKVSLRVRNAILSRINGAVRKYGFNDFKAVANKYILEVNAKNKLKQEIIEREKNKK